jgi:adenylate cyclase
MKQILLQFKRDLPKILIIAFVWVIFGTLYSLIEYGLLGDSEIYPSTQNPYDFKSSIILTPILSFFIGFILGTFEFLFLSKFFKNTSFWKKVCLKTLFYIVSICISLFIITMIVNSYRLNLFVLDEVIINSMIIFFNNFAFWSIVLFIGLIISITLFVQEISNHLGQGILKNFFIGKYHESRIEKRAFVFLDMKSSTTIAEKLGHVEYYKLLNDYYSDMTESIINTNGQIYQYVGDEVIISWEMNKNFKMSDPINCFFDIEKQIALRSDYYIKEYQIVPEFKAGIHFGEVTIGEIGVLKKEIVFTGDVLNTTSRIQSVCKEFNSNLLISDKVRDLLTNQFKFKDVGEVKLKGKEKLVKLYKIPAH